MTVTAPCTAEAVRDWLIKQIGTTEQPPGSNMQPYGAEYGWNGVAWCQILQWCAQVHGGNPGFYKTASTIECANWFRKNGAWGTPSITPPMGSLIYFDWGQGIAHVGFVEGHLADGRIATIEGNTDTAGGGSGGRVMRQNRGANIAGYGLITYQSAASEDDDMPYIAQLKDDFTYQGQTFAAGYAVEVFGQVRNHLSLDQFNERVGNGRKVLAMSSNEMTDLFNMTVTDVHRLLKA